MACSRVGTGFDGADVGHCAIRRDCDPRFQARRLRSRLDGLAARHLEFRAEDAVGVVDGAQRATGGGFEQALVEDGGIGDDGQRPRQATTGRLKLMLVFQARLPRSSRVPRPVPANLYCSVGGTKEIGVSVWALGTSCV